MSRQTPEAKELYAGAKFTLHWLDTGSDEHDVEPFLASLSPGEQKKVFALVKRTGDHGPPRNEQKCGQPAKDLFELKSTRSASRSPTRVLAGSI